MLLEATDVCVSSLLTEFPELWKPFVVRVCTCSRWHLDYPHFIYAA